MSPRASEIAACELFVAVKLVPVRVPLPVMVPLPRESAPMVSFTLVRFRVAPLLTETLPPARALVLVAKRVPPFTMTPPVKLLLPDRVAVPVPVWVSPPDPLMLPASVRRVLAALLRVTFVAKVTLLEILPLPSRPVIEGELLP